MAPRRGLIALVALAACLHAVNIARTLVPAQDGLKFLRIARQFAREPWADVVRNADQHPLYPALVALVEPVVAAGLRSGQGPDTWRIAGQGVSAVAALAVLVALFGLSRSLFDDRVAALAVLLYVLLPFPAEVGRDTLSDALALLLFLLALRAGGAALLGEGWTSALACGLLAGLGFLTRPEALVVPVAVLVSAVTLRARRESRRSPVTYPPPNPPPQGGRVGVGGADLEDAPSGHPLRPKPVWVRLAALGLAFLVLVGGYALVKGEVSEKLALRQGAALKSRPVATRKAPVWLPPGLDDPRWDFSPKEEAGPPLRGAWGVSVRIAQHWAETLGWVLVVFVAWGLARERYLRRLLGLVRDDREPDPIRRLIAVYALLFCAVLIRHAGALGYLSRRHVLTLVVLALPWAAAGVYLCAQGLTLKLHWGAALSRRLALVGVALLILLGGWLQLRPAHATRWGHWAAGHWLAAHATAGAAVLDTRGWAAFIADRPSYDYWHVRQALTDARLAYIVVGVDELDASSRRAKTLRALLAYAAEPAAEFPDRPGGRPDVRVYRFHRPESWEGLRP